MKLLFLLIILFVIVHTSSSQGIAINNNAASADPSAMLDVSSNSKGILIPRMEKTERCNIIDPAIGLLVFQSGPDSAGFYYFSGTKWQWLASAGEPDSNAWSRQGNTGTDSTVNFIGTLDNQPLQFRHNNKWIGKWSAATQNYLIGDSAGSQFTGSGNIAIGAQALKKASYSDMNIAIGHLAMSQANGFSLFDNTAIGRQAMFMSKGYANTAMGSYAMVYDTAGSANTAIGFGALYANRTGIGATSVGGYSSAYNDTAMFTTAVGYETLFNNRRDYTTALGAYAGYGNSYGATSAEMAIENTMIGYAAMAGNAKGSKNTVLGYKAMSMFEPGQYSTAAPSRNVAIGDSALQQNRGDDNVAVGFRALSKNTTTHHKSVAVGSRALKNAVSPNPNIALGYLALDSMTTGSYNTALGTYSMSQLNTGVGNTAIGHNSMYTAWGAGNNVSYNTAVGYDALKITKTAHQVAIGAYALREDTAGVWNVAIGVSSMLHNKSGAYNTAVGTNTLSFLENGSFNSVYGTYAMHNSKTSMSNTAFGQEAMRYDTSGSENTSIGRRALWVAKNPIQNVAVGAYAMEFVDSARFNVAVGRGALCAAEGEFNTAIGHFASGNTNFNPNYRYQVSRSTTVGAFAGKQNKGNENTFIGFASGEGIVDTLTGTGNTGLGAFSLYKNTSGAFNTALGSGTLYNNETGYSNVAIGVRSLYKNITGMSNVAVGDSALHNNAGSDNTAIGTGAMFANTTGFSNVGLGYGALTNNTTGQNNIAIGRYAMTMNGTGNFNTAIGFQAEVGVDNLINATAIGANASVWQDNSVVIGSVGGINGAAVTAKVGIGTPLPNANLHVKGTTILGENGTAVNSIIRHTHVYDIPSLSPGATHTMAVNVPGAAFGGSVSVSPLSNLPNGLIISYAHVSAANTVVVTFINVGAASINPVSTNYYIAIIQ